MFGNSYPSSGVLLSPNHAHTMNNLSSLGLLSDENSNNISPFTLNDFPQLGSLPISAGELLGQSSKHLAFMCLRRFLYWLIYRI